MTTPVGGPWLQPTAAPAPALSARSPWQKLWPPAGIVVGVLLLPAAVLSYRHGITANNFHWPEASSAVASVDRYNGAWIGGAFGLALLGLILIVVAVGRLRTARSGSQAASVPPEPEAQGVPRTILRSDLLS